MCVSETFLYTVQSYRVAKDCLAARYSRGALLARRMHLQVKPAEGPGWMDTVCQEVKTSVKGSDGTRHRCSCFQLLNGPNIRQKVSGRTRNNADINHGKEGRVGEVKRLWGWVAANHFSSSPTHK